MAWRSRPSASTARSASTSSTSTRGAISLAIARRFFAAEESAQLEACGSDERSLLFHQWWTRKEAVLKATGIGLRGGLTVRVDAPADRDGWRRVTLRGT